MKIMQIMHYPGQGGAEQYAYLLAKNALKSDDQVLFVFGQQGPLVERVEKLGCEVRFLIMKSPFDIVSTLALQKIIKEWQPEIIHTHFLRENFLAIIASRGTGVRAVFSTVHRIEPKTTIQVAFNRLYSRGLTKFIAVSEIVKDYLKKEKITDNKLVVIPLGVEFKKYDRKKLRQKYGFKESEQVICSVGRLSPEKGLEYLIKAFVKVNSAKSRLVIVGSGKLEESYRSLAKKLKVTEKVEFLTEIDNAREVIVASDLYIQPSEKETFGLAAVEAISLKVPVILSDIPAFQKIVGENERGLLFKAKNVNDLAKKMESVLKDPTEATLKTKKAYQYVEQRYRDDIMWQKTRSLYEKYCEKC